MPGWLDGWLLRRWLGLLNDWRVNKQKVVAVLFVWPCEEERCHTAATFVLENCPLATEAEEEEYAMQWRVGHVVVVVDCYNVEMNEMRI